ncbi:hypothetical protein [Vallitalea guaymasensis]|uniref:hypothetical protein n=1 Tax=Vallitalea guaymasensis TaxID=1185412 RepID=UPI00272DA442|nr:hypothetical protein [Vallitalea guaymasensis]
MKRISLLSMCFLITVFLFGANYVHANGDDQVKPEVVKVIAVGDNMVEITFNEELDETTAEDISNYSIEQPYGAKLKLDIYSAELNDAKNKVIITTNEQNNYSVYMLSISNVVDVAGNVIDNCQFAFVGM